VTVWPSGRPAAAAVPIERWRLSPGAPLAGEPATCAWVAGVTLPDGSAAVLKVTEPHLEATHEAHGLRVWDGDPTVRLLDADADHHALLLERCDPGTPLRREDPATQDEVIGDLLRRIRRRPLEPHPFRPLAGMLAYWRDEARARRATWTDPVLAEEGLACFAELGAPCDHDVLLATDLHAGNVLRAGREPWLAIDPKPFVGDRAYDATQHLLNSKDRLLADPEGTLARVSERAGLDPDRVRAWTFARLAVDVGGGRGEPRDAELVRLLAGSDRAGGH